MTYSPTGAKTEEYKKYWLINFVEKNISGIEQETVDGYSGPLGKLFRWLQTAIQIRKDDILKRKIQKRKEREERATKQQQAEEREAKRKTDLEEAFNKFEEEHKDEIEAYEKFVSEDNQAKGDDYGEEEEEEQEEVKPKEKPERPVFNEQEHLTRWDEENLVIVIPEEVVDDIDNDWELTEEDEEAMIQTYQASKQPE